jgi:hypothetical protein
MDAVRRRLPSPRAIAICVAVVAVPGLPWLHARSERIAVEHRAAAVASEATGRAIRVRCPGPIRRRMLYEITEGSVRFDADGVPSDDTRLSARTCDGLRIVLDHAATLRFACLATGCGGAEARAAEALAVLTHETMHLRGTMDEARTECLARAHVAWVAERLGVAPEAAQAVARWQATTWQVMLPDQYRGGVC